jgi:hypothetical protein
MKFDENINKLLKKYPLNEDFGNLFGTLGRMAKNAVVNDLKYIAEPTGLVNAYNAAKPDLSKGDDIVKQVSTSIIEDPNISNKKISYILDSKPIGKFSYKELQDVFGNTSSKDPKVEAKQIINSVDLNKSEYGLNVDNSIVKKKILEVIEKNKKQRKEYGEDETRADLSVDRVVQRYQYLIKGYFKPFNNKDIEEKIKWLYILANNNKEIKFSGELPEGGEKEKEGQNKSQTKPQANPQSSPQSSPQANPQANSPQSSPKANQQTKPQAKPPKANPQVKKQTKQPTKQNKKQNKP